MGRTTRNGIDFFSMDCNFDDKIEMYLLEKEATGLAVMVTLWQLIYSNNGYYINNGNDLYLLIKKRINVNINEIKECINCLIARDIFDKKMYEKYKILTSRGVQKRYFDAAKRKQFCNYDERYIINGITVSSNAITVNSFATKEKEKEKEKELSAIILEMNIEPIIKKEMEAVCELLEKRLPSVQQMEQPLTADELMKLIQNFGREKIVEILIAMENWKKLKTKKSAYLTAFTWAKKEAKSV